MNFETLQEELSARLRAAQASSPNPAEGSEALKALNLFIRQRPMQAAVAVPMLLSGVQTWGHSLMMISLAYATLGIKVDMKGVAPSAFMEKLLKKDETQQGDADETV